MNCPKCGNEMKKELTLEEIFKDYDGEYAAEEFDWGSPAGKEV